MLPQVSRDDAAGQIWGLYSSGKQIKPDPVSRDDVAAKIWGLYRSGKQTTPDPALRPSSRHKSTKNRRPLPPRWPPADHLFLDLFTYVVLELAKEESSDFKCALKTEYEISLKSSSRSLEFRCFAILVDQRPHRNPRTATLEPAMNMAAKGLTLIQLMFPSNGLGPDYRRHLRGPISIQSRPNFAYSAPIYLPDWPRFALINIWTSPLNMMFLHSVWIGRRRLSYFVSTKTLVWLCLHLNRNLVISSHRIVLSANIFFKLPKLLSTERLKLHAFSPVSHCAIHLPESFTAASGSRWRNLRPVFDLLASHGFLPNFQTPRDKRFFKKRTISEEETIQEASSTEEDWKKAQVDSKKILAQPHQSATANLSRLIKGPDAKSVVTAIVSKKPPIHLIGAIEDIINISKTFSSISFNFIPRSENMFSHDLAQNAIRSMTSGSPLYCNSVFI